MEEAASNVRRVLLWRCFNQVVAEDAEPVLGKGHTGLLLLAEMRLFCSASMLSAYPHMAKGTEFQLNLSGLRGCLSAVAGWSLRPAFQRVPPAQLVRYNVDPVSSRIYNLESPTVRFDCELRNGRSLMRSELPFLAQSFVCLDMVPVCTADMCDNNE